MLAVNVEFRGGYRSRQQGPASEILSLHVD